VMMATFCSLPMMILDVFPSLRDCGCQSVWADADQFGVFGGTAEWPTSGRHSSHKRKNEGVDQDFSATTSVDSLANAARRRAPFSYCGPGIKSSRGAFSRLRLGW
jgi:hypothetical protein